MAKKKNVIGRAFNESDSTAYGLNFQELSARYDVPEFSLSAYYHEGSKDRGIHDQQWRSLNSCELFVRGLFVKYPTVANIFLITQDLSATVAILHVIGPQLEELPPVDELVEEIHEWCDIILNDELVARHKHPWLDEQLQKMNEESEYVNAGTSMNERFNMVQQLWYKYHTEACEAVIERIKTESDPKYLKEAFKVLGNEYDACINVFNNFKSGKIVDLRGK